jgi:hypothetical protein
MGSSSKQSADFPALALDPGDNHAIVPRRPVAHPGDHRSLGRAFDWDALGSGHGAAANRRCVIGDGTSEKAV